MKKASLSSSGFLSLLLVFLLAGCQSPVKQKSSTTKKASSVSTSNSYVYRTTNGLIKAGDNINMIFRSEIDITKFDKDKLKNLFSISPDVPGIITQNGSNSIVFQPKQRFEFGKEYKCTLNYSDIYDLEDDESSSYDFTIKVLPLDITVLPGEIVPYDDRKPELCYLDIKIISSQNITIEDDNKLIKAQLDDKELKIKRLENETNKVFKFRVEDIVRPENDSKLEIIWDGISLGSEDNGTRIIDVIGMDKFLVSNVIIDNGPDQAIKVFFSDPLNQNQDLNGLVTLNGKSGIKYDINKNELIIYPDKRIKGNTTLLINQNVKNYKNKTLENEYYKSIFFGQLEPTVEILNKGTITPGDNNWNIDFKTVNLSDIDIIIHKIYADNILQFMQVNEMDGQVQLERVSKVIHTEKLNLGIDNNSNDGQWHNYSIDISNLIDNQSHGIFKVEFRFKKEYSLYECNNFEDYEETDSYYSELDYYTAKYYYPPNFRWSYRDNPCSDSYYYYERFTATSILASNIGLILKGSDEAGYKLFANDLLTAEPISNLLINVYDYQQQLVREVITNNTGIADIRLEENQTPWMITGQINDQYTYLKVKGNDPLSYSRFETDGNSPVNGISGFVYGDRGVWRPGDTLFITMIAIDMNNKLPEEHPATLSLYNPRGKKVRSKSLKSSKNGFYSFKIVTSPDDITGVWKAKVNIGGAVFSKNLRIENIKPNRLKIKLSFREKQLTKGENKGNLLVTWLHGGIASGLRSEITATLRPVKTVFEGFKGYSFDDITKYFYPYAETIIDRDLNKIGELNFSFNFPDYISSPGKLNATMVTKVFEKGGDFSINQKNILLSPYNSYVGVNIPDTENGSDYLESNKNYEFSVATVDPNGKPISINGLKVQVYRKSWSWWYGYHDQYSQNYMYSGYNRVVYEDYVNTKNGHGSFTFGVNYPDWGYYYVQVTDPASGHSCGAKVYFDWPSSYSRDNRQAPGDISQLILTADKKKYKSGDIAKISFPTPLQAKILVSLERNDEIIQTWWQDSNGAESTVDLKIIPNYCPNIYVSITVIQPFGINNNSLPARMYGVIPIMVEDSYTRLIPQIKAPDVVRPNSDFEITVGEKNGREMTYTIAIVDEGLLDLTGFSTPDPHGWFYAKQSLNVSSWDIYDYVKQKFNGDISKTFAVGGSDLEKEYEPAKKKANRFKPVVKFIGPFTLSQRYDTTLSVSVPNYVGSIKAMLVAGENDAFGSTSANIKVNQPLMVLATLPRVLAPTESMMLPVSVFCNNMEYKDVTVKVHSNTLLNISDSVKTVVFTEIGENVVFFDMNVGGLEGIGKVSIEAISGDEKASYDIDISIVNPNPRKYLTTNQIVEKGEIMKETFTEVGMKGSRRVNLSVSSLPQIGLDKRLKYLIKYPYHCIEQTTSAALPQLFLSQIVNLTDKQVSETEFNITAGIKRIIQMQLNNGGFTYWPGSMTISDWGSTYAGNFLIIARDKGYNVPISVLESWSEYQTDAADLWSPKSRNRGSIIYNDLNQAYRLYTLALYGKPNISAMNRMKEMDNISIVAQYQLASAYVLIGQQSIANNMINNIDYNSEYETDYYRYSYGSNTRNKAIILKTLQLLKNPDAIELFKEIAIELRSNSWMSTQTTAFALTAIASYFDNTDNSPLRFKYSVNGEWTEETVAEEKIYQKIIDRAVDEIEVMNTGTSKLFTEYTTSYIPEMGNSEGDMKNLKMDVAYKDMNGNIINHKDIKHGTDFYAEITITNNGRFGDLYNLALSQVFPDGWEIINTRMFDIAPELKSDNYEYIDYRDDRVDIFFNLRSGRSKRFVVLLNAAYLGKFYQPSSNCSDMYNNNVSATTSDGWVEIK